MRKLTRNQGFKILSDLINSNLVVKSVTKDYPHMKEFFERYGKEIYLSYIHDKPANEIDIIHVDFAFVCREEVSKEMADIIQELTLSFKPFIENKLKKKISKPEQERIIQLEDIVFHLQTQLAVHGVSSDLNAAVTNKIILQAIKNVMADGKETKNESKNHV